MLGGPVLGAALHERRTQEAASRTPTENTELLVGLREKAALLIPPSRVRDDGHSAESADEP
jgi:hypothetical protein